MSTATTTGDDRSHRTGLFPRRLTAEELSNAPALASLDALVIENLTDEEYDRFLAALAE